MATPTDKKKQPYTPLANQPSVGERGFGQTHQHMKTGPNATDDSRHAYNLVESEFGPSRTASMQQLSRLGSDRQYEQGIQENFGQVHDQTLQEIAQQLQQQLGGVTDRVQGLHKGASSVIGDAYGRAQGATQGASQDVLAALADQMGRLGLQEAGRDPNAELAQQQTDMSGRHAISGVGAVGNAEALGADMTSIAAMRQGDAAQDWAGKRDDLAQQVMANVNQINHEYNQQRDEVFGEIQALERARGQALSATHREVVEERLERERQDKLDELSAEMARRGMGVQEGYLGLAADRLGLDTELGRGNLGIAQGQLGVAQGGLDLQRQQLEIHRIQAQREYDMATSPEAKEKARLEIELLDSQLEGSDIANELALNPQTGGDSQGGGDYRGFEDIGRYAMENMPTEYANYAVAYYWKMHQEAAQDADITSKSYKDIMRNKAATAPESIAMHLAAMVEFAA